MFPWYTLFMTDTKIKEHVSFESWEKKETFDCAIFGKVCHDACGINRAGQYICLRASLHNRDRACLSDNPALKNNVQ